MSSEIQDIFKRLAALETANKFLTFKVYLLEHSHEQFEFVCTGTKPTHPQLPEGQPIIFKFRSCPNIPEIEEAFDSAVKNRCDANLGHRSRKIYFIEEGEFRWVTIVTARNAVNDNREYEFYIEIRHIVKS
jgi:hypothetical protein